MGGESEFFLLYPLSYRSILEMGEGRQRGFWIESESNITLRLQPINWDQLGKDVSVGFYSQNITH